MGRFCLNRVKAWRGALATTLSVARKRRVVFAMSDARASCIGAVMKAFDVDVDVLTLAIAG